MLNLVVLSVLLIYLEDVCGGRYECGGCRSWTEYVFEENSGSRDLIDQVKCGKVFLTVSSLHDTYLELNWLTNCQPDDAKPEYIALYNKDVSSRNEETAPLVRIKASNYPSGYYRTKVRFGHPWLPGNWEYSSDISRADPGPHCFPYWIAAIVKNEVLYSNCLAIQPTWMNDNRQRLGTKKIGSLFIPGTHNSGSYSGVPSFIEDYVLNQDRSVWAQLVFGIRYLDFRIGYYDEGFYINHDLVRISKILPVFKEIKKFAKLAPGEIIIVDFHRFPYPSNFNASLHEKFINFVYSELGDLALPPGGLQVGKGPTLNEIWNTNKNLIICYGDRATARDNHWLWHPIQQFWGNTKKANELHDFLDRSIKEHRVTLNPLWALMAELTPQPIDLIFRTNNLRKLADDINRKVTKWFREDWERVNIVATDYFLANNLINVAIEFNNKP